MNQNEIECALKAFPKGWLIASNGHEKWIGFCEEIADNEAGDEALSVAAFLQPSYEFLSQRGMMPPEQPGQAPRLAVQRQAMPVELMASMPRVRIPLATYSLTPLASFDAQDQRFWKELIDGAEQLRMGLRAQRAGITLASNVPRIGGGARIGS